MGLSQFKETIGQVPSERDTTQKGLQAGLTSAREPYAHLERISYGIITDMNYANYQVKVKLFGDRVHKDLESKWQPLITQQDEIFLRWGQLRKGMHCRIHWRGRSTSRRGFVEIIGDENTSFVKQKDRDNEVKTQPYKFLGGGITAF